ncbi:hypothetical protein [Fontivita pretiosa]|uniref:hypothetical protein n=1 Tax=Fontivita pretiosa TaxID=2989684 RepID=UPI003D168BDD
MSPLTKLFVVLLVVLSLLLTAGVVVFVNQVDDYKRAEEQARALLTAEQAKAEAMRNEAEAARASAASTVREITDQLEKMKQQMNQLQQQAIAKDAELAQARSQAALQAADLTRLAEGLKASEDTKSRLQDQLNETRASNDTLLAQNAQLNQTVTDLTNRLEVTERERKFLAEQLAEAKNQMERQAAILRDMGVSPAQLASAQGIKAGAPPINGVIRAVRPIAGIPYATISVGSADGVQKGMEFKVVERGGNFLGILTVDSVELNEATGKLSGEPGKLALIKPGVEVKTQL